MTKPSRTLFFGAPVWPGMQRVSGDTPLAAR